MTTSLARQVTITDRNVGLFWDFDSLHIPPSLDQTLIATELYTIASTFSSTSQIDTAWVFGDIDRFSEEQKNKLWATGFELVQTKVNAESTSHSAYNALLTNIMLWLWDNERRVVSSRAVPCVILVTSAPDLAPLLSKLRHRSVYVVLVTELSGITRAPAGPEMRLASHVCIEWHEIVSLVERSNGSTATTFEPQPDVAPNANSGHNPTAMPGIFYEIPRPDPIFSQKSTESVRDYLNIAHDVLGDDSPPRPTTTPHLTPSDRLMLAADMDQNSQVRDLWQPMSFDTQVENVPPFSSLGLNIPGSVPGTATGQDVITGFGVASHRGRHSPDEFLNASIYHHDSPKKGAVGVKWGAGIGVGTGMGIGMGTPLGDDEYVGEQSQLTEDLIGSFRTKNVKVAVSTLRKIYTKQTRTFRITSLLADILTPQGVDVLHTQVHAHSEPTPDQTGLSTNDTEHTFEETSSSNSEHVSAGGLLKEAVNSPEWLEMCLFALTCIQWCFGVQKGSKVESFKYKMNKNIARWILKELQRKGVSNQDGTGLRDQAVLVVREVLQHVVELDLSLEILETFGIDNPLQVLRPYVASWVNSDHPTLAARAADFAHRYSLSASLLQERHEVDYHEAMAMAMAKHKDANPNPTPGPTLNPNAGMYVAGGGADVHRAMREVLLKRWTSKEHPFEELSLEDKLILLLAKNPNGVMGARIPALFRDEYGEALRLGSRRKLKDVLLASGKVLMLGQDGPGDKLFKLKPRAKAEIEARMDMGYSDAPSQALDHTDDEDFLFNSPHSHPNPHLPPASRHTLANQVPFANPEGELLPPPISIPPGFHAMMRPTPTTNPVYPISHLHQGPIQRASGLGIGKSSFSGVTPNLSTNSYPTSNLPNENHDMWNTGAVFGGMFTHSSSSVNPSPNPVQLDSQAPLSEGTGNGSSSYSQWS